MNRKSAKRESSVPEPFPPVFLEALAYHESGHAVMAVLLGVPMLRLVIGPACGDPDFNGQVELDLSASRDELPLYKAVLIRVASEPAEKLAPRHAEFATMHKAHRHLAPFGRGVRADLIHAFDAVAVIYLALRLAEGTARKRFKREYRDLAHRLFEVPALASAVHRLAAVLMESHELTGEEAEETILSDGPLRDGGLLAMWRLPPP